MAVSQSERPDPLGRAMRDYQRGEPGTLSYRDGDRTGGGRVREHYFRPRSEWGEHTIERLRSLEGPVLDVGCGAGQHVCWLQDHGVDVVGVDVSPGAVEAARSRGGEDVRRDDMFDLPFDRDRFRSLHCIGTQLGLAGSLAGISELLAEFARVTGGDGVAVVDNYDPRRLGDDFLGYRFDPRTGVARRCFHFEYERDGERVVGPTLQFLLCSPARLEEATIGTPWAVTDVRHDDPDGAHYVATLAASREARSSAGDSSS
ncbi:class I SAM-dependent methyltransferase [Natronococcus wangiae]|uniref:class I SAM-dependent methyltransferase n=1 Tax=Natronococcus wangiae TaxID=3068275 RepID=UPI00273D0DFF|nr:class I SAM-dependent methyltransferase [Natronococcus sp. AD5]